MLTSYEDTLITTTNTTNNNNTSNNTNTHSYNHTHSYTGYIDHAVELSAHIQSYIQFGEKFKAYPICVNHCHIPSIIHIIKHHCPIFKEIVGLSGSYQGNNSCTYIRTFVVQVKVCIYAENQCSCWIIIGNISKEM